MSLYPEAIGTCTLALADGSEMVVELIDSFDGETYWARIDGKPEVVKLTIPGMVLERKE